MVTETQRPDEAERFRSLYADAYEDVLRFVQRRVDPAQAEDVAAEAFLVAWRRIGEAPTRPEELRPWLFGVARNCLLNARRGRRRSEALAVRVAEATPLAADGVDPARVAMRIDLASAWKRLTPGEQEVLALTVFDDLDSRGAGAVLGITPVAYRVRLARARRSLRRKLDRPDPRPHDPTTMETAR